MSQIKKIIIKIKVSNDNIIKPSSGPNVSLPILSTVKVIPAGGSRLQRIWALLIRLKFIVSKLDISNAAALLLWEGDSDEREEAHKTVHSSDNITANKWVLEKYA